MQAGVKPWRGNPWTSPVPVLSVATGKRISYCVHTYAEQSLQQERPFSHSCAAPAVNLKCDSISLTSSGNMPALGEIPCTQEVISRLPS